MPYTIAYLHIGLKWIGGIIGQITCKFVHFSYQVSIPASIFTVMLVSLDRFFAIMYPMKGRVLRNAKIMTTIIWVSSTAYAIPFMIANDILKRNDAHYCVRFFSPFDNKKSRQIYYFVTFVLLYCAPLVILMVLYTFIARKLWKRQIPGNVSRARFTSTEKEKRRIIKGLILIVVVFAVCWLPAHIMHYFVYYRKDIYREISPEIEIFFFWLCHANSTINPCLYVLLSQSYRRRFWRSMQRVFFCGKFCCHRGVFHSFRGQKVSIISMRTFNQSSGISSSVVGFSFKSNETVCTRL